MEGLGGVEWVLLSSSSIAGEFLVWLSFFFSDGWALLFYFSGSICFSFGTCLFLVGQHRSTTRRTL